MSSHGLLVGSSVVSKEGCIHLTWCMSTLSHTGCIWVLLYINVTSVLKEHHMNLFFFYSTDDKGDEDVRTDRLQIFFFF